MAKTATPQYGRGVLHADNPTPQQIERWRELGAYPATRQAIDRAIGYLLAEKAREESAPTRRTERPDPSWIRGRCPQCGEDLVSHLHYVKNEGYYISWDCWASQGESPTCDYRKVL